MTSRVKKGVRYALLIRHGTRSNSQIKVRMVGHVTHSWPDFNDPTKNDNYMQCHSGCWAVVQFLFAPNGHVVRAGCLVGPSIGVNEFTHFGPCDRARQGIANARSSLMVWKPGHRIVEVAGTRAAGDVVCPTAIAIENLAALHNYLEHLQLRHHQEWHFHKL